MSDNFSTEKDHTWAKSLLQLQNRTRKHGNQKTVTGQSTSEATSFEKYSTTQTSHSLTPTDTKASLFWAVDQEPHLSQEDPTCARQTKQTLTADHFFEQAGVGDDGTQHKSTFQTRPQGRPQREEPSFIVYANNVQSEKMTIQHLHCRKSGRTAEYIKEELEHRLREQLERWNTETEAKIFHQREKELYVKRSLKGTLIKGDETEQLEASDILQLLKQSPQNAHIIVIGEAGSGKTSLLRHISISWLQNEGLPYDFVFHIPLGRLRSHDIPNIICQDMSLLPEELIDGLSEMLCLKSKSMLFLLDSYEDLRDKTTAIEKLITGDIYCHAAVVVTTRPGSNLTKLTKRMSSHIETYLADFSEDEMTHFIRMYLSQGQKLEISDLTKPFFGSDFLKRPFNLAMACYLYDVHRAQNKATASMELLATQTVLMSQIVQHTMQAYIKKKKGLDVAITTGSPLNNKQFPAETKAILKEVSRMCFHAFKQNRLWLNVKGSTFITTQDLLDFGLFTSSSEPDAVSVPHSLFLEYLAAVYLVDDEPAWEALYAKIKEKSKACSPGMCLEDAVRPLENVVKFVAGLSPVAARQLSELFVIKQQTITAYRDLQTDLSYEMTLLTECNDFSTRSTMAGALLKASVSTGHNTKLHANNKKSHQLLEYFNEESCLLLLEKLYGCHKIVLDNCPTLFWMQSRKYYIWDDFAVRCVEKYSYLVQLNGLRIYGSTLPVDMLLYNMTGVDNLFLDHCTLRATLGDNTNTTRAVRSTSFFAEEKQAGQNVLVMISVKGLDCLSEVILPAVGTLRVYRHQDIDVCLLFHSFTELDQLHLEYTRLASLNTFMTFKTWDKLKRLHVKYNDDIHLSVWAKVFVGLNDLVIVDCKIVLLDRDNNATRWSSLSRVILQASPVKTAPGKYLSESTARHWLSKMCSSADIYMYEYEDQQCNSSEANTTAYALREYDAVTDDDISFLPGDIITDVKRSVSGWWTGTCHGKTGRFPPFRVSLTRSTEDCHPCAVALRDFQTDSPDKISFHEGDVIKKVVFLRVDLWHGNCNGRIGYFIPQHVRLMRPPGKRQGALSTAEQASADATAPQDVPSIPAGRETTSDTTPNSPQRSKCSQCEVEPGQLCIVRQ